jgi:hypothetical protein
VPASQILAIGFLLVILSAALFEGNFLTLLVVATYVLAPVPNWICSKAQSHDDFMDNNGSNSIVELGRFLTGFLVVMGIGTLHTQTSAGRTHILPGYSIADLRTHSATGGAGALRADHDSCHGYEHFGRPAHLWHDHRFWPLFQRTGGVLRALPFDVLM